MMALRFRNRSDALPNLREPRRAPPFAEAVGTPARIERVVFRLGVSVAAVMTKDIAVMDIEAGGFRH